MANAKTVDITAEGNGVKVRLVWGCCSFNPMICSKKSIREGHAPMPESTAGCSKATVALFVIAAKHRLEQLR